MKTSTQPQQWLNNPFVLAVLVVLVVLLWWRVAERVFIAQEVANDREQVERTVTELRTRHDRLESDVQYLESERGQEAEMRRQFDVALPGERVVVIVDEETADEVATVPTATTSPPVEESSWYEFWR